jgi:hypothetical protein
VSLGELMELGAVQEAVDAVISERALEGRTAAADAPAGAEAGDVVAGDLTDGRPVCAMSGRSSAALRKSQHDPFLPFEVGLRRLIQSASS